MIDRLQHIFPLRLVTFIESRRFAVYFAWLAVIVLAGTTVCWTILGARVQQSNADQLINALLFKDRHTLAGASFPGQHTFLLKWPLFYLIKLLGFATWSFVAVTVGVVLATVLALAYLAWRLIREPLLFGVFCLALASILLLIPTQPYPGALLPVNMAMLTTRNIEYVVYILSLFCFVSAKRMKQWRFVIGVLLAAALVASDNLFLILSVGSSLLSLVAYAFFKRWTRVSESVRWFAGAVLAAVLANIVIQLINLSHLTHIVSTSAAGPYNLISSPHSFILGVVYGIAGLFTNFGANPAYAAVTLSGAPRQFFIHMLGFGGPGYIINTLLMLGGLYACIVVVRSSLAKTSKLPNTIPYRLAAALVWGALIAAAAFVSTDHYYVVDARYLTLVFFAAVIAGIVVVHQLRLSAMLLTFAGSALLLAIASSIPAMVQSNAVDAQATNVINNRDKTVVDVLSVHPALLIGDYWRVVPISELSAGRLPVVPLASCSEPSQIQTSSSWQPDLRDTRFVYLLSYDVNLTNYPHCNLSQVLAAYGKPNNTVVVAGTIRMPKELLLFYDHGTSNSAPLAESTTNNTSTVSPTPLSSAPNTSCAVPTVITFVAHEDDDILFMNPDIYHAIKAGYCIRTVFVTAGDAGANQYYWLSREHGAEAAYSLMAGASDVWENRTIQLADNEYTTFANPRGNSTITLVFLHLPDGNLTGGGFKASHFESLAKLYANKLQVIHAVDGQSTYTKAQLVTALMNLMSIFSPTEIHTQSAWVGTIYHDHNDHNTVGALTKLAYAQYEQQQFDNQVVIPIKYYVGYPVHTLPPNVSNADLQTKAAIYFAYSKFDGSVCHSNVECRTASTLGLYLQRQYQYAY